MKAKSKQQAPEAHYEPTDPAQSAKEAGLRYVTDNRPGIRRKRSGKSFTYIGTDDRPIRDPKVLDRVKSLGIPPAYRDVWICLSPNGHLQATGKDARGRKQYRYHPRWREVRDSTKYDRMISFGAALPEIRRRCDEDLSQPGMPKTKVLATVVKLLEKSLIRVGNDEYARTNNSYGLTTMLNEHVDVEGATVKFHFRGKHGKEHEIDVQDRKLARIVAKARDLPGDELFEYVDSEGNPHTIDSGDVNAYLHDISGEEFTAKDFRTWAGTVLAALALKEFEQFETEKEAKHNIVAAIESVSKRLGNTPAICRKCYVNPVVLDAYLDGSMVETLRIRAEKELSDDLAGLPPEEAAVLAMIQQRLAEKPKSVGIV